MLSLEEIAKKYETAKKTVQSQKLSLRQQIEQQIQIETINALKVQNHKVSEIHKNQKQIETKLKRNSDVKHEMEKQLYIWTGMYEDLNKSLKKAGDLAHYAYFIQDEVNEVAFLVNPQNEGSVYKSRFDDIQD